MTTVRYDVPFAELAGQTFVAVERSPIGAADDYVRFFLADGSFYEMYHSQNCCESVFIESINGELADLVGTPILSAVEVKGNLAPPNDDITGGDDSYTWTFYTITTIKGFVEIRWYGTSSGYYSEEATLSFRPANTQH